MPTTHLSIIIFFMSITLASSCMSRAKEKDCKYVNATLTPLKKCDVTSPELVGLPTTKCILTVAPEFFSTNTSECKYEHRILASSNCTTKKECIAYEDCLRDYKLMLSCAKATDKDLPKNSLPNVQGLTFSKSTITTVKKELFKNVQGIKVFRAMHCRIEAIEDDAFQNLVHLSSVDVSYNKLKKINLDLFRSNSKIRNFDVKGNKELVLSDNEPFLNLPQLERLNLQECNIEKLPSVTFKNMPGLFRLNLAKNNLRNLPGDVFKPLNNLWWLDLSDNKLKTMSLSAFGYVRPPLLLLLTGNPWECDCLLYPMIEVFKSRGYYTNDAACAKPSGKKWRDITLNCPR